MPSNDPTQREALSREERERAEVVAGTLWDRIERDGGDRHTIQDALWDALLFGFSLREQEHQERVAHHETLSEAQKRHFDKREESRAEEIKKAWRDGYWTGHHDAGCDREEDRYGEFSYRSIPSTPPDPAA